MIRQPPISALFPYTTLFRSRRHGGGGGRYRHRRGRRVAVVLASDVPLDLLVSHQKSSPPSRAPSASAAMRPAYRLPPRSKTTAVTPAALARSAIWAPTCRARADLSPSAPRRPIVDALASVRPAVSSTSCTWMCRDERLTTRRGRSGVPVTRLRRRDRKSTRLNSSHANISYAVFCLKKKQ